MKKNLTVRARVSKIVEIIGRQRARVDEIEKEVTAFDYLRERLELYGLPEHWYRPTTKADKKVIRNFIKALERVERLLVV